MEELKTTVVSSPPMRSFFVRLPAEDLNKIVNTAKPGWKPSRVEQELLWLLQTLWEDGRCLFLARMPVVVDELERLLRAEPSARALISGYVSGLIGDLSIVCECLQQLDLYQPWANGYENASVDREGSIKKEFEEWEEQVLAGMMSAMKSKAMIAYYKLADPSDMKFFYPTEKRRTKETVEALREAEANLDAFWDKFDKCLSATAGDLSQTALRNLLSQKRVLQRTPEWTEPAPEVKAKTKPVMVLSDQDVIYRPLSTIYFDSGASCDARKPEAEARPRIKVKARGVAKTPSATGSEQSLQKQQSADRDMGLDVDRRPTFMVDSRALKVFRTLFFHSAVTSTPGEVSWNDFLHAMTSVGFSAEKLYGSVWHFQPSKLDVERSIQFHEPHPVSKIPFTVARRIGRRLSRAYGWLGAMFALKEKET